MRKAIPALVLFISSVVSAVLLADGIAPQYTFSIPASNPFYRLSMRKASESDFTKQITERLINGDSLARAVSEVQHIPVDKIVVVSPDRWNTTIVRADLAKLYVTIWPGINSRSDDLVIGYSLAFSQSDVDARSISILYNKSIAPQLKELSQHVFDEHFAPVMAEAQKAKDTAEADVQELENQRRMFLFESYKALPYEKVADHLADLQHQQLSIKLSLVGMEARQKEIEMQLDKARQRLQAQAEQSATETASDELLSALKQLVALREKTVEQLSDANKNKSGAVTQGEINEAMVRVVEAKVQFLSLESKKQPHVNSEQLESLQNELTRLAIDRSESQARWDYLEKMNQEAQERIERRTQLDLEIKRIDDALPQKKNDLRSLLQHIQELEGAKADFRPIDLTRNDG